VRRLIGTFYLLAPKLVFHNSDLNKSTTVCNVEDLEGFPKAFLDLETYTAMRCTPVRYTPMRYTPVRCTPMRYTPVRCTPMVHACEMHVYEVHTHEMHAYEEHAHEVCPMHARKVLGNLQISHPTNGGAVNILALAGLSGCRGNIQMLRLSNRKIPASPPLTFSHARRQHHTPQQTAAIPDRSLKPHQTLYGSCT
jgi:hypothetical protein